MVDKWPTNVFYWGFPNSWPFLSHQGCLKAHSLNLTRKFFKIAIHKTLSTLSSSSTFLYEPTKEDKSFAPNIISQLKLCPHLLWFCFSFPYLLSAQRSLPLCLFSKWHFRKYGYLKLAQKSHNGSPFVTARNFKLWSSDEHFKLEEDWLA